METQEEQDARRARQASAQPVTPTIGEDRPVTDVETHGPFGVSPASPPSSPIVQGWPVFHRMAVEEDSPPFVRTRRAQRRIEAEQERRERVEALARQPALDEQRLRVLERHAEHGVPVASPTMRAAMMGQTALALRGSQKKAVVRMIQDLGTHPSDVLDPMDPYHYPWMRDFLMNDRPPWLVDITGTGFPPTHRHLINVPGIGLRSTKPLEDLLQGLLQDKKTDSIVFLSVTGIADAIRHFRPATNEALEVAVGHALRGDREGTAFVMSLMEDRHRDWLREGVRRLSGLPTAFTDALFRRPPGIPRPWVARPRTVGGPATEALRLGAAGLRRL